MPSQQRKADTLFAEDWQEKQAKVGNKQLYVTHGVKCFHICRETVHEAGNLHSAPLDWRCSIS